MRRYATNAACVDQNPPRIPKDRLVVSRIPPRTHHLERSRARDLRALARPCGLFASARRRCDEATRARCSVTHRARLQRVPLIDITTSSVVDARARVGMRAVPREALATLRAIGARRRPRARASVARGSSEAAERVFASTSESATAKLARALARTARNGDVICLRGRVGS